jgi:hypothetical protein
MKLTVLSNITSRLDWRSFIALCPLLLSLSVSAAEVYKCEKNGAVEFSDQPCSEQAQTIRIEVHQPEPDAVSAQQSLTATFEEESRISEIRQLNQRNDELEQQMRQAQQQHQVEMQKLQDRTYDFGDGRVATREYGLFEKMDQLDAQHQQNMQSLQQQIEKNQQTLEQLYP